MIRNPMYYSSVFRPPVESKKIKKGGFPSSVNGAECNGYAVVSFFDCLRIPEVVIQMVMLCNCFDAFESCLSRQSK